MNIEIIPHEKDKRKSTNLQDYQVGTVIQFDENAWAIVVSEKYSSDKRLLMLTGCNKKPYFFVNEESWLREFSDGKFKVAGTLTGIQVTEE